MRRKISKIIFALLAPIACFLLIGIFSFSNISGLSSAIDYGGAVYVGNKSTLNMTSGTIRGFSANYGGGVYIASGGTFNLSGGSIYGNSSTYSAGKDIYNSGTFTMTGGTVGSSGTTVQSGIYNYGTMNLYGGNVYDDIYSPSQLTYTKMAVNISGTINLSTIGTITVQDYAGTTPTYKINLTTSRGLGAIVIFIGSSTAPDLSKLSISGYDDSKYMVATEKNSSGNWTVALKDKTIYFPSTWKTELASTDYMTTTVSERDISGMRFETSAPSGYSQIGTLSTGIKVYKSSSSSTQIAFVNEKTIYAPESCISLFGTLFSLTSVSFNNFDTSKVTSMTSMFSDVGIVNLDLSGFDTSKVTSFYDFLGGASSLTTLKLGSKFVTSKATDFFCMFQLCSSLKNLDLSNFDTSNVVIMSGMFSACNALESLNISSFNTSNVTEMNGMFNACYNLKSLDLSNFNTSKVTDVYGMFADCTSLENLNLSSFNLSSVSVLRFESMLDFGSDNKIKTLKTPYNNTSAISITTGSTLYNTSTGSSVTSVPSGTTSSKSYAVRYTISFNSDGGTSYSLTRYAYHGIAGLAASAPVPTRSGYIFLGWYYNGSPIESTYFTQNCTVVALWKEEETAGNIYIDRSIPEIIADAFDSAGVNASYANCEQLYFYSDYDTPPYFGYEFEFYDITYQKVDSYLGTESIWFLGRGQIIVLVTTGKFFIDPSFTGQDLWNDGTYDSSNIKVLDCSGLYFSGSDDGGLNIPSAVEVFYTPVTENDTCSVNISPMNENLLSPREDIFDDMIYPYSIVYMSSETSYAPGSLDYSGMTPVRIWLGDIDYSYIVDGGVNWVHEGDNYYTGYVPKGRPLKKFFPWIDNDLYVCWKEYGEDDSEMIMRETGQIDTITTSGGYMVPVFTDDPLNNHFLPINEGSSDSGVEVSKRLFLMKNEDVSSTETCILPEKKGFVVEIEKDKKVG